MGVAKSGVSQMLYSPSLMYTLSLEVQAMLEGTGPIQMYIGIYSRVVGGL